MSPDEFVSRHPETALWADESDPTGADMGKMVIVDSLGEIAVPQLGAGLKKIWAEAPGKALEYGIDALGGKGLQRLPKHVRNKWEVWDASRSLWDIVFDKPQPIIICRADDGCFWRLEK